MKKWISVVSAVLLLFSICACSVSNNSSASQTSSASVLTADAAQTSSDDENALEYENTAAGFGITHLPDSYKSSLMFYETGDRDGDIISVNVYCIFPKDGCTLEQCLNDKNNIHSFASIGTLIFSNAGNDIDKETMENWLNHHIGIDSVQELTRNDGHNLYFCVCSESEIISEMSDATAEEQAAATATMYDFTEMAHNIVPLSRLYPKLSFSTIDFDGNPITSEECFSGYDVTLLNCWASFCSPCKEEMPELVEADKILRDDGCQVLLLLCDTDDRNSEEYQDAVALLKDAGASGLKCIIINDEIEAQMREYVSGSYPTSYAVGSDGQILGAEYGGDRSVESFVDYVNSFRSGH